MGEPVDQPGFDGVGPGSRTRNVIRRNWVAAILWTVLGLFLVVLGWSLFGQQTDGAEDQAADVLLQLFPGYEYQGQSQVRLSELGGHVVVIHFWADWCVECRREAETLEAVWQKYRDRDVVFVGVDWMDADSRALSYLERYQISYPNGPDPRGEIGSYFGVSGVPETHFVDVSGLLVHRLRAIGPLTVRELTARVEELLKGG
jgi:cytochrome c biogenesis protein CcmG/thiol:disulfide interchange protein DsbE